MFRDNSPNVFESFKHAFNGLSLSFKSQRNIRIESAYLLFMFFLCYHLKLDAVYFLFVMFSIVLVIITEILNTAIEFLGDLAVKKAYSKSVKSIKDVAAAAVLVSVIFCVLSNVYIILNHLKNID